MKKDNLYNFIIILLGNFLLAISVTYFVLPYDLLSGGAAGIAIIVSKLTSVSEELVIDLIVVSLFFVGYLVLGKEFAKNTLISTIAYPLFLRLLDYLPICMDIDRMLAAIFGGAVAGIGLGLVFQRGASTGGMDIPPLVVHKFTGIPVSSLVFATDVITTILGLVVYGMQDVLMGIIYIFASSYAINKAMVPFSSQAVALYIISDKCEEIKNYITVDLFRGSTILKGKGGYTGDEREVLLSVIYKNQYVKLSNFINRIDPYAFVIVSDAKEIKGEGFTYETRV